MNRAQHLARQIDTSPSTLQPNPTMSNNNKSPQILHDYLNSIQLTSIHPQLDTVIYSVAHSSLLISQRLNECTTIQYNNTDNVFGDHQLNIDVDTDNIVFNILKQNQHIATASSEESPTVIPLHNNNSYSVTFDPLDGSSIIDANITVGSIYSIFSGSSITDITGRANCVASMIAVYGPRLVLYIGLILLNNNDQQHSTQKYCIECTYNNKTNQWIVTNTNITLSPSCKYFAPANLRCAAESSEYMQLIQYYITNKYTLRYTGGLVPDIAHMLSKRQGIFISPISTQSKPKLRLLYEVIGIAYLIESCGGSAIDQHGVNILDINVSGTDVRTGLICGSMDEINRFKQYYSI